MHIFTQDHFSWCCMLQNRVVKSINQKQKFNVHESNPLLIITAFQKYASESFTKFGWLSNWNIWFSSMEGLKLNFKHVASFPGTK